MTVARKAIVESFLFLCPIFGYKIYMKKDRPIITFVVLAAFFVLSQFYRVSSALIAPSLVAELGLDAKKLGLLGGSFFYSFAILQIPMGFFLDRVGPRLTMSFLPAIGALGAFVFSYANEFESLLLGRVLLGIGMAGALMGSLKVFAISYPRERFATLSGLLMSSGTLGNIIGSSPLAYLSSSIGWRRTFQVFGAFTLLLSFLLWFVLRPTEDKMSKNGIFQIKTKETLLLVFKNLSFWQIGTLAFFRYGTFVAMQGLWFGPYLISIKGFSPLLAGNIIMMLSFGIIIGSTIAGYLTDKVLKCAKRAVLMGVSLYALFILLFVGIVDIRSTLLFYFVFLLLGLFSSFGVLVYPHVKTLFPGEISATVMSGVNFFTMAGGAFFMQVMGNVIHLFKAPDGSYPAHAYHFAFLFCFLGLSASLLFYSFSKTGKEYGD